MANAPSHFEVIDKELFVEPLGGPAHMEELLESFPENLYDKSPSSRFYKFFYSLMGPSGVGQLVRNYFEARLIFLEQNVELFDIERFYWNPFEFGRIFEEQSFDDIDKSLLPDDWEKIKAQDASYRSRALDFVGAARLGTSPQGMRLAAKSGLGSEVGIFERYNWIFDQISDQPIGVKNYGSTLSLNEFVVLPRPTEGRSEVQQLKFESTVSSGKYSLEFLGHRTRYIEFNDNAFKVQEELRALPSVGQDEVIVTGGPAPFPFTIEFTGKLDNMNVNPIQIRNSSLQDSNGKASNAEIVTISEGSRPIDSVNNVPERLLHSMQEALDRLRPVNSFFTFRPSEGIFLTKNHTAAASSNYFEPIRFVTGSPQVNWPPVDEKFWIQSGVEKAAKRFYQEDSAHYVSFHKIQNIVVESDGLTDPNLMVDPNPDLKPVINNYVNGIYPVEYFGSSGTSDIAYEERNFYWSSLVRSYPNSEVIEIDLGQSKVTNFISLNIGSQSVKVKFEYCVWENSSEKHFQEVVPADSTFSGFIPTDGTKWSYLDCQFLDQNQNLPLTRYLKITIERLDDRPNSKEFSVDIKNLKVGRNLVL